MNWRPWPRSLAGQLVWILFSGVLLSLISSAAIHLHDRATALSLVGGLQTAQRFASIVQVFDPLSNSERIEIASILNSPTQLVHILDREPPPVPEAMDSRALNVQQQLGRLLGNNRAFRVIVSDVQVEPSRSMDAMPGGFLHHPDNGMMPQHHLAMMSRGQNHGLSYVAQVRLTDGTWIEFYNHLPKEMFTWPWHLLWSLVTLFVVVFTLSLLAVRLVTRPLARLAAAARALGQNINSPPVDESGTLEVQEAANAFNVMQARLIRYIQERTHLLAAISHDLKTPLTRMRLRVEMVKDDKLRTALLPNLDEMENMAAAALDYIQGVEGMEEMRLTDITSMIEELQEAYQELGHQVEVRCGELTPFPLMGKSFKRALSNLIQNAVKYGERPMVKATMHKDRLRISISDHGPGIPDEQMQKVLEPFVRLEDSRNRKTGGTGLGLSIAHTIVRAHNGEMMLRNQPGGGLEVTLIIPHNRQQNSTPSK